MFVWEWTTLSRSPVLSTQHSWCLNLHYCVKTCLLSGWGRPICTSSQWRRCLWALWPGQFLLSKGASCSCEQDFSLSTELHVKTSSAWKADTLVCTMTSLCTMLLSFTHAGCWILCARKWHYLLRLFCCSCICYDINVITPPSPCFHLAESSKATPPACKGPLQDRTDSSPSPRPEQLNLI